MVFILIAAGSLLWALIAIVAAFFVRSTESRIVAIILALVFLLPGWLALTFLFPELVDARFRTYKQFYDGIQTGMTREQVLALMETDYPTNGLRKRPQIMNDTSNQLGFFMNPETSREPNCEGILLTLEHGRVVKKDYSAD